MQSRRGIGTVADGKPIVIICCRQQKTRETVTHSTRGHRPRRFSNYSMELRSESVLIIWSTFLTFAFRRNKIIQLLSSKGRIRFLMHACEWHVNRELKLTDLISSIDFYCQNKRRGQQEKLELSVFSREIWSVAYISRSPNNNIIIDKICLDQNSICIYHPVGQGGCFYRESFHEAFILKRILKKMISIVDK